MDVTGESRECAVDRRARRRRAYHAQAAAQNYARQRYRLLARIRSKGRQIEELELRLEEEVTRGYARSAIWPIYASLERLPHDKPLFCAPYPIISQSCK
jgi:hypothetical protein